ncbi:hypothetical protein DEU56DRAFT_746738 [Suillus clintonianus]|uniref:uncharacterized protein n=1 Tax=Suillus clintonianus TaxID=1904413 RepID=UPI001B87F6D3|nr:uncharacterized protein DEU56DRAFT_746738 [Suillus clintonianus]KAG2121297.1 hypothetical protein DEU56DRAFT_746738 [Suillus clintonianus]
MCEFVATNTSLISITKISGAIIPEGASAVGKAVSGRVTGECSFGMVWVARNSWSSSAVQTSQDTLDRSHSVQWLLCHRTCMGSLSNVLLMLFINERRWRGSQCLYWVQGVATRNDIDKTFRLGMAHPTGPLQLGELLFHDAFLSDDDQRLYKGTSDSKHRPLVLLECMTDAQYLEKKNYHSLYL